MTAHPQQRTARKDTALRVSADRALPHDAEAERSILGAILLDDKTFPQAQKLLSSNDFFSSTHGIVFDAMLRLAESSRPVDPILLISALRQSGELDTVGGAAFIGSLIDGATRTANLADYCRLVKSKAIIRGVIYAAHQAIAKAFDGEESPIELCEALAGKAFQMRAECDALADVKPYTTIAEALGRARAELRATEANKGTDRMASGFTKIDKVLGGGFNNEIVLLAAETSKGKSLLAHQFVLHNARINPDRVGAIFTLEMGASQLGHRTYQIDSGIQSSFYKTAQFVQDEIDSLNAIDERYKDSKVFIYDPSELTLPRLYADCLALKQAQGRLDYVVIDYLDLMSSEGRHSGDYERIKTLMKGIIHIKRALDCNFILPVQLKPDVDFSKDQISYNLILYASALVPHADIAVLFQPGTVEGVYQDYKLHFKKNRNAVPFSSSLRFNRTVGRFENSPDKTTGNNHPDSQE